MKNLTTTNLCRAALILGTLVSLGAFASAQSPSTPAPAPAAIEVIKHSDRSFLEKAAKSGMEEVAISQVAVERALSSQVKDFAQMMVSDHTSANDTLAEIATNKGVTLPVKQLAEDKWLKKSEKDFDADYVDKMVSDHESAVKLFTKEANDGKDEDVVAFARKTLPKLQAHLEKANDLKRMLK